jgi:hypothetical protein
MFRIHGNPGIYIVAPERWRYDDFEKAQAVARALSAGSLITVRLLRRSRLPHIRPATATVHIRVSTRSGFVYDRTRHGVGSALTPK